MQYELGEGNSILGQPNFGVCLFQDTFVCKVVIKDSPDVHKRTQRSEGFVYSCICIFTAWLGRLGGVGNGEFAFVASR